MSHRRLHDWESLRVLDIVTVTPTVRRIVFERPSGPSADPGSHMDFSIPLPEGEVTRSYSVVDDGRHPEGISVAVRLDPASRGGSLYMHQARPGDVMTASQPVQNFELTWGRPSYLLLSGGIGVTPIIGMARRLRRWGANYRIVHAGRSQEELPFADELEADHPGQIELHRGDTDGQLDLAALVASCSEDTEVYVCGPIGMLEATRQAWAAAARPASRLRFETFGSSGSSPAQEFSLRVPRHDVETIVPPELTALDALGALGVEVMSDCLRGECGLCMVTVLSHDCDLDHRDVFLSPSQKARNDQLALCVSRAKGGTVTLEMP